MPPLTKKQRRARDQRASRARVFTSGLIEDLSNKTTDLNYQPDSDSDVSVQDISFHHIDREVISDSSEVEEGSTESNNNPVVCIGEKRKVRVDTEDSDNDHIPVCACLISRFRSFIFYQAEKKSSKCSMNAMPSYTGAGRTSTYCTCGNGIYTMLQKAAKKSHHSLLRSLKSQNIPLQHQNLLRPQLNQLHLLLRSTACQYYLLHQ